MPTGKWNLGCTADVKPGWGTGSEWTQREDRHQFIDKSYFLLYSLEVSHPVTIQTRFCLA